MQRRDLGIKHIEQLANYCGPACFAMVANYYGIPVSQEKIALAMGDPEIIRKKGVYPSQITTIAPDFGLRAQWKSRLYLEEIIDYIDEGTPTIAIVSGARESFHYVVIGGYEQYPSSLLIHDPELTSKMELYNKFSRRWRTNVNKNNWIRDGIVISK